MWSQHAGPTSTPLTGQQGGGQTHTLKKVVWWLPGAGLRELRAEVHTKGRSQIETCGQVGTIVGEDPRGRRELSGVGGGVLPGELGQESGKTGMDMSWGADCAGPSYHCLLRPSDPGPPGACILLHIENHSTSPLSRPGCGEL